MSVDEGLFGWIQEALEPIGSVTLRRMMGGATLYLDGTIFGILHGGELWFKADAESDSAWDARGCTERFTVTFRDGSIDMMNYRRAPADAYDDPEAMQDCARLALEAGARRVVKKKRR